MEAGIAAKLLTDLDADLVVFNLMTLAHGWALRHWHFGPRATRGQDIRAQLRFVLTSLLRPDTLERYRHLMK